MRLYPLEIHVMFSQNPGMPIVYTVGNWATLPILSDRGRDERFLWGQHCGAERA